MTTTVSLKDVCKTYQEGATRREVLQGLSLQVFSGETVAFLGSSGSGKSTLLNIVGGLTPPDSGQVEVVGTRLESLDSEARTFFRRQQIGFIFQFFHLIPTLTVEENLRLPLQLNEQDDLAGRARVSDLLQRVGLAGRETTFPDRLSGGEQQRVAICRALVHRPPLILADEPTGNLDSETAGQVLELMLTMGKEEGATLLMVTHSESTAAQCDRIVTLVQGRSLEATVES